MSPSTGAGSPRHTFPTDQTDFFQLPIDEVLSAFRTSAGGLPSSEAAARLARYGPNQVEERPRSYALVQFFRRFANPLILILLVAAGISAATGDRVSFVIIVVMVFLSVILDFVQERRAGRAAEALRQRVALMTEVARDGQSCHIPIADLVPGDVVSLSAGGLVPADCRLIAQRDLFVNEALLTGESLPVEKTTSAVAKEAAVVPTNGIFMGSSVVSGTATALVLQTGRATQFGAIAHSLRSEPQTAFELGIRDFGLLIVRLTVLLVLFALLINLLLHRPILESFLFALALAVGLTPELLPMVVSVTLAHGAIRMAEKQVIVKRLSAIHDLGSMDVLCSDKTGTLTEAKVSLVREIGLDGAESTSVLRLAYLNAAFETGVKSPLDVAILDSCKLDVAAWRKIDEVPFDFERRRVSVLLEDAGTRILIVKGAPEDVLCLSNRYDAGAAGIASIDQATRKKAEALLAQFGEEGFRVLGIAWREVEADRGHAGTDDEKDLIFAGFALFLDPPKASAAPALEALRGLGVTLKILTGDNEHTARHVCSSLKLQVLATVTGDQIASMTDEALDAQVETANLFCRIRPMQKARIIRALRRRGHVVGYIGDGINDAPSINAADAGLSVDSAVDVAKQAASIILLEKNLGVLVEGVKEGRRTFANILKYIAMGTSSNFGNMFSMAGAVLMLPFLPMLPIQILLNNFLYDLSEVAIPLDRVDAEMTARPHRWNMKFVRDTMLVLGPISSAFDFLTFALLLFVFRADEARFHTAWFVESLATQILVIFIIRTRGNPFRSRPHPALTVSSLAALVAALAIPYSSLGAWLGFVPLPLSLLLALAAATILYLGAIEAAKIIFRRRLSEL